jgi:hypothetical protein
MHVTQHLNHVSMMIGTVTHPSQQSRGVSARSPRIIMLRSAAACVLTATLPGAMAPVQVADAQQHPSPPPAMITQDVLGTVQSIHLRRIVPNGDSPALPFYISQMEITWDLYDIFVYARDRDDAGEDDADAVTRPSKPYISMDRGFGKAGYPAISMSYLGAQTFCEWLSTKTGRTFRLPTQAEWQAACESSGVEAHELSDHAWFKDNSDFKTHPVGKARPDENGVHDLYGNAAEWCTTATGQPVIMGGCYRDAADKLSCQVATAPSDDWNASDPQIPKSKWWLADGGFIGFRIVCEDARPETTENPGKAAEDAAR